MTDRYDVLIVGAGHAGAAAATALRQVGFEGAIAMIGDEPDPPYERPPLSKAYLSGEKEAEDLLIRPRSFWEEKAVTLLLGRRVESLDPAAHTVTTADGATLGYGSLIWAAGGAPRKLTCEGGDLKGVHAVRTRADVDQLMRELPDIETVVVVGGGYIGLEAAAVLTKLGKAVTVLEAQDRVLARVAGEALSRFYQDEHRRHGVDIRLNATADGLLGDADGRVRAARLADGTELICQAVIVGIGIIPAVEPLRAAGAGVGDGVEVDTDCRTSLIDVFAIGDCARQVSAYADGAEVRIESVNNAAEQAGAAARAIAGQPAKAFGAPWFWSDQYDLKLQTAGLQIGYDRTVVRGDPAERAFSVVYLKGDRLIAVDCVNAPKDFVQVRMLLPAGIRVDVARLADASLTIKELALTDA